MGLLGLNQCGVLKINIIQMYVISIVLLFLIDRMWNTPCTENITKKQIKYSFIRRRIEVIDYYFQSLISDVLEDNPEKAVSILENKLANFNKISFIRYRKAYLLARNGQLKKARTEIKNDFSRKALVFKKCLDQMACSFTMTDTLYQITKKYGVHQHFGYIESLIRKNKMKLGAEIGVFMGFHPKHLLEACRNLRLYCVDIYANIDGNGYDDWDNSKFDKLYLKVKSLAKKFKRARFLRMLSENASKNVKENELDFVFIDADHRYEGVKNDLTLWEKKVKTGGIVSGHDYMQKDWPGVKIAVDEWVQKNSYKLKVCEGNLWWIKK
jgi:predicted O-methyltransferase YrrM